jgi:hypothetical protein
VDAQRVLGCNILPARTLRPTDKQAVERAFGALRALLFEQLPGYTGVDVADRGVDPEADAVLTITQMEHLVATWTIAVWQNRRLGEHAPAWGPGEEHSPNTLFAAAMQQGGFAMQIPKPELYYQLLPAHYVKIHGRRGVKIGGLWYDGRALGPHRGKPSGRGGKRKDLWVIRSDRRDRRTVFFQDPADPSIWHTLRWSLPPEGEAPAFSDKTAVELLAEARARGLSPQSDSELLPVLLELLGALVPVNQWPTQLTKSQRTGHARQAVQAHASHTDRSGRRASEEPSGAAPVASDVVAPAWPQRVGQADELLDAERRRRREAAVPIRPEPPPLLRDALRGTSIFHIPDDITDDDEPLVIEAPGDAQEGQR